MTGYDLDGVITTGKYHPSFTDVIITANYIDKFAHVMKVMKEFNVACPVYFNPYKQYGRQWSSEWKAEIINKLGVSVFYEDNEEEAMIIKASCPNTTIIKV